MECGKRRRTIFYIPLRFKKSHLGLIYMYNYKSCTHAHCGAHLGLASQSVQEAHVGEHAILVLGVTELSKQLLDISLGHLVTEVAQDVVQLSQHHSAVGVLVVELQQLQVVTVLSLGVGGGNGSLDLLDNIIIPGKLLTLLISLAQTNTGLLGDVETQSVHHVSEEEQVDLTLAIPIVDVADVLNLCVINHFEVLPLLCLGVRYRTSAEPK